MAVAPQLSDAEITSLLEIAHPSKATGESIHGATKVLALWQSHAVGPASLPGGAGIPGLWAARHGTDH